MHLIARHLIARLRTLLRRDPRRGARELAKAEAQRRFQRHDLRNAPDDVRGGGHFWA